MQKQGDVAVVSLLNKRMLDESNIQALYDELRFLVVERGLHRMVLDFAGVEYLTSAVLGKLISLMKTIKENRGRLRICNVNENVAEIFSLTELDQVFGLDPGIDESIRAIKTGAPAPAKRGWWPWRR
jgi:anti-sigma B factor antagonist